MEQTQDINAFNKKGSGFCALSGSSVIHASTEQHISKADEQPEST